jgi:uncharacterized protein YjaG (DUF416 family)
MAFTFDESVLAQRLERLPTTSRVAFAAACAQRMAPSYERYFNRTGTGDPALFKELLSRLWTDLAGQRMSDPEIDRDLGRAESLLPPEDDPWVPEYAAADDAAAALAYSFESRRKGAAKDAVWAARRAYETLDDYVITHENIDTSAPGAELEVLNHPLVQAELARQSRDLDELREGRVTVEQVRDRAKAEASISFHPIRRNSRLRLQQ